MLDTQIYSEYIHNMPTTVHIPPELLRKIDERAKALKVSRNRFVIKALQQALISDDAWSSDLIEALEDVKASDIETVDEMLEAVVSGRTSKKPVSL